MNSKTSERFRECFAKLPEIIKKQAKEAYVYFRMNPYHPSLHFKQVHPSRAVFSARISENYRTLGVIREDGILWFWIGSHADYNKILNKLREQ